MKLRQVTRRLLDLLFPQSCLSCRKPGVLACLPCLSQLPQAERDSEVIRARYAFASPLVRASIWQLKYKGARDIAEILGTGLSEYMLEELVDLSELDGFRDPLLIPAPLSQTRERERGFNQAELIAREVARLTGLPLAPGALHKVRDTPTQVSQDKRHLRLANLKNAFSVPDRSLIVNRNVIVIDDVYTTGATVQEIARTLKSAGAKRVLAFTVAH